MHAKSSQFEMQLRNGELPIIKREKCVCVCVCIISFNYLPTLCEGNYFTFLKLPPNVILKLES